MEEVVVVFGVSESKVGTLALVSSARQFMASQTNQRDGVVPLFGNAARDRLSHSKYWRNAVAETRMLGQSRLINMGDFLIQQDSVVWDADQGQFRLRMDFFSKTFANTASSPSAVFERSLNHGEVLPGTMVSGTIVDQVNKRLILPNDRWIDGPTGNIYGVHGNLIISRDPKDQPNDQAVKAM